MGYTRILADSSGESHFEDVEVALRSVDFAPPAPPLDLGEPIPTIQSQFFSIPPGWFGDWHCTPRRQFYLQLEGILEVEVSDGEVRRLQGGAVVLLDDLTGTGHASKVIGDVPITGVFLQL